MFLRISHSYFRAICFRSPALRLASLMLASLFLAGPASVCRAHDATRANLSFPRIANCYGSGIGWQNWEQGSNYWRKLDLIIGGYSVHYDWDSPSLGKTMATLERNIAKLRQVNSKALILPYVDVVEGPDNPNIPTNWWALNGQKERWSGWPGFYRLNTDLPEVLRFNLDKVRAEIMGRNCFDGVFYDCWKVDDWLVPQTGRLRNGRAVVMVNTWNLPAEGFEKLNGVLSEDEINRIIEGKVSYEDFLRRYLRWTQESRKPTVTTIVCHPQTMNTDAWRWTKLSGKEKDAILERARGEDEKTMRFGLTTALMGNGYFGFDAGSMGRGSWWWYKEYDAPLGLPKGIARRNKEGAWQREFEGGTVVVNGTAHDVIVEVQESRDLSAGRVGTSFTIPSFDGRIFLPFTKPVTTKGGPGSPQ